MRILHCITGLTGDGAQRMLLRLAESMSACGVQSSVVNLGSEQGVVRLFEKAGIRVWSLNIPPTVLGAMRGVGRLRSIVKETRPDVVQGWMYHANALALFARSGPRPFPAIAWNIRRGLDDYHERRLKTRCMVRSNAMLAHRADGVIFCSLASKIQHEGMGLRSSRSIVLENGFDAERFSPRPQLGREFRQRFGIRDDEILIGNVGRFDIAKGHSYLIEAFSRVLSVKPALRLVLIGRGVDDANRDLMSVADKFGCRSRLILLGEQGAVEYLHPVFDIYCSSSISEGFPNALSEAMACGVTCVATDTGASRKLVEGIGRVVPPRSVAKLAEALVATIDDGAEGRTRSGMQGRRRIINHYTLPSVARRYHDFYDGILGATCSQPLAVGA